MLRTFGEHGASPSMSMLHPFPIKYYENAGNCGCIISSIVPNQLLFGGILLVINFFSPKVLILGKTV